MGIYQIKEFGKIKSSEDYPDHAESDSEITIPNSSFNNIWDYILEQQSIDNSIEKAFKLFTKKGKRVLQVQNYVGVIETRQKDIIEILPKIYSSDSLLNLDESKNIFLKMLSTLRNSPFLSMQTASIDSKSNFPILEIFVENYIQEVEQLVLLGLKNDYLKTEDNISYLKGSLIFNRHLQRNLLDKSRFYVRYIKYQVNIPQNKIIKATLRKLVNISVSSKNRGKLTHLLNLFSRIDDSQNIISDLAMSQNKSRLFSNYSKIIEWSETFLLNKGFTNFSGNSINQAILFPMEKIFENFIAYLFRKYSSDYQITTQHREYFLVDKHRDRPRFQLRPDIFARNDKDDKRPVVIDTKWKVIDETKPSKNYLIKQSDMYQLYAYGRKYTLGYSEPLLYLIYPMTNTFKKGIDSFFYEESGGNYHLELRAVPFDLSNTTNYSTQLTNILERIDRLDTENNRTFMENSA